VNLEPATLTIERSGRTIQIAPQGEPLDRAESAVWTRLSLYHVGRQSAIPIPRLAEEMGIPAREMHDILKSLLVHHGLPVVSACTRGTSPSPDTCHPSPGLGVYVATCASDVRAYVAQLRSRFRRMYPTYRAAKRLMPLFRGDQENLFAV